MAVRALRLRGVEREEARGGQARARAEEEGRSMSAHDEMSSRVLGMFDEIGKDALDLHELFEAGGNDPDARRAVFFAVENLVERGLLEERGNDFYTLTEAVREAARKGSTERKGSAETRHDG